MKKKAQIGISLSGGGARGIAHIGVLAALEEHGIFPEVISGTSAGSIVGAMYAAGHPPAKILEAFKNGSIFRTINLSLPISGLTTLTYLKEQLAKHIETDSFEALPKKLFIAVTNLTKGEEEIVDSGPLFDVVMASSSIPLVFKPVLINKQLYVDGGVMRNMPVEPVKEVCDFVIGSNVMPYAHVRNSSIDTMYNISFRVFDLVIRNNSQLDLALCDLIIEPRRLTDYHPLAFHKAEAIYQIGYQETKYRIAAIQKALEKSLEEE